MFEKESSVDLHTEEEVSEMVRSLLKMSAPRLPSNPTVGDLLPFVRGLKTKRLRKKFLKYFYRYWSRLPAAINFEYISKSIQQYSAEWKEHIIEVKVK